jgi:hypothetical protein
MFLLRISGVGKGFSRIRRTVYGDGITKVAVVEDAGGIGDGERGSSSSGCGFVESDEGGDSCGKKLLEKHADFRA